MPIHRPSIADSLPQVCASADTNVATWPGMAAYQDTTSANAVTKTGTVGRPLPYNPRTDDVTTVALLLSSFATLWLVVHSWGFIARTAASFFYDMRPRRVIPVDGADLEETGDARFLHAHTAFLVSLAYLCHALNTQPQAFIGTRPYGLLFIGIGLTIAWYIVRMLLYKFINNVFFEKWQHTLWVQARTQCTLLISLVLLPILLIEIYFIPPSIIYTGALFFIIGVSRFGLFMKAYNIFFSYRGGLIHLLLYFCTLEIAPLVVLWRLMVFSD